MTVPAAPVSMAPSPPLKEGERRVVRVRASIPRIQEQEFRRDGPGYQGRSLAASGILQDFSDPERQRAIRLSRLNYKRSGVYGQVLDTIVNFVLGDGIAIECEDETVHDYVEGVLEDPANAWDRLLRQRVTGWLVDGEFALSFTVPHRPGVLPDGSPAYASKVLLGRMDIDRIDGVEVSPVNEDRITAVIFNLADSMGSAVRKVRYPIAEPPVVQGGAAQLVDNGDGSSSAVGLWQVNRLGRRGLPFLSRSLDKATMLDAVVDELARKAEYTNRFYLHGTYADTGDKRQNARIERTLLAFLRSIRSGEAAVTTDNVKVNVYAPDLKIPDVRAFVEMLLEYILGSHGIPRMWYGSSGETNRATAVEQGTPIHRAVDSLQAQLQVHVEDVVRFVIYLGKLTGQLGTEANEEFDVTMTDVATRDSLRDVNEISGLTLALDGLVSSKVISPLERQNIGRAVLTGKGYGVHLDPDEIPDLEEEEEPIDPEVAATLPGHRETGKEIDPAGRQAANDEQTPARR